MSVHGEYEKMPKDAEEEREKSPRGSQGHAYHDPCTYMVITDSSTKF